MRKDSRTPYMIALLVSLLLFLFFTYQSYNSYRSYQIAQSSDKYISFLYRCDNLLKNIENERLLSANYIGKNGKLDFKSIQKARRATDSSLDKAKAFTDIRPDFSKDLQYVRSRVDVISDDHNSIFFKYYQDELSNPIIKQIDIYTKDLAFGISDIKRDISKYKDLITDRNNINQKNSFISYILSQQKKLNSIDLELLDRYIKDIKSSDDLDISDSQTTKVKIIQGATTGEYSINQANWQQNSTKNSQKIDSRKKALFLDIQSTIKRVGSKPKALMYYLFASLIFLISSVVFIRKFRDSKARKVVKSSMVARKKDFSKQESKPQHVMSKDISVSDEVDEDIVLKYSASDIPLTNGVKSEKVDIKLEKTTIRAFDPMQTFTSVVGYLIQECEESDIGFKYNIDSDISNRGIGNVSKIDEVFKLFVEYILDSTTSKDLIILDIENIAQTKMESAIRFTLFRNSDVVQTQKSANLTKIKSLLTVIGGNFDVEEVKDGRNFIITINIKRN